MNRKKRKRLCNHISFFLIGRVVKRALFYAFFHNQTVVNNAFFENIISTRTLANFTHSNLKHKTIRI